VRNPPFTPGAFGTLKRSASRLGLRIEPEPPQDGLLLGVLTVDPMDEETGPND
jgi:hypothetical protein